jgi:hypothetical protein
MSSSPRTKGRSGEELALELDKVIDGMNDKTIALDMAAIKAQVAGVELRIWLGHIEYARARGEKPELPFFAK